jgi:short-subunit dehydrogenase
VSSLAAYTACPGLAPYNASKAAVELFANALRLEVSHLGVDVGSAHMSWIDTAMVLDSKADLSTFGEMLTKLPYPLNRTTSVHKCGQAFVKGIERRKRRINSPAWVGAVRWLRPTLSTRIGEAPVLHFVPDLLPRMDAEVAALDKRS